MVTLLREGRASMATSFQSFKFIELYALIQFFSVVLLIPIECNLTDRQFLFIDLVALVPLSIFQARTGAYDKLSPEIPTATLFYAPVLASVAGSAAIQFLFQLFFFLNVRQQTQFYTAPETVGKETIAGSNIISYEDTVLFFVSSFQYVVTAIAFSVAKPFRKPIHSNISFLLSIILITCINLCFLFLPNPNVNEQNTDGSNWLDNFFLIEPFYKDG